MFRILLIRHGSTDPMGERLCGRMPGILLNDKGRKQAATLGFAIREETRLSAVYASPLERTVETARYIADAQQLPVSIREGLNEFDFGSWMGLSFHELHSREEWRDYNRHRSLRSAPKGESLLAVQARAWSCLQGIQKCHDNEVVAAVTHGDVIRSLILLILGIPLDFILRLEISPASATEVNFDEGGPRLAYLNRTFASK